MSQGAEFSARRSQTSELVGEETGQPMIKCPQCKRARVFEARSKKDNANFGRVYVKCSRNFTWMADTCLYYRFQRQYFNDLVKYKKVLYIQMADTCLYYRFQRQYFNDLVKYKKVQVFVDEEDEEQEVQSIAQLPGSPASGSPVFQSTELEAKVEKLTRAMQLFVLFAIAFVSMGVGYAMK